ncbi:hypothetical protein J3R30DRAFT_692057 [Lentinula aciculospora]|uniref:DUF1264-domain-containing protein n=1 Tax=Lentinula aciculospora TaxID=153920 RepID=A0A9W9DJK8_9AGAR|nr:hypothetical protein J3R30DRAFT_692057 [Lentinula aciculospora]
MSQTSVPHDPNTAVAGEPITVGEKTFDTLQQTAFSFKPIANIKQALCAVHPYAAEPSRVVPAYHYCTHNISSDLHQSNEPSARLIGMEYIITEKFFKMLDNEEKRLWHSHKYEIESGGFFNTTILTPSHIDHFGETLHSLSDFVRRHGASLRGRSCETCPTER